MTYQRRKGISLIETLIFIVLLSMLLTGTIDYLYSVHIQEIELANEINDAQSQ